MSQIFDDYRKMERKANRKIGQCDYCENHLENPDLFGDFTDGTHEMAICDECFNEIKNCTLIPM